MTLPARLEAWLTAPQRIERLELIRIVAPLILLGFLSSRLIHADEWISSRGFQLPDLGGDWRQPVYIPALPPWAAWSVALLTAVSALALSAGLLTRIAAGLFTLSTGYLLLADRLEAFTVGKLAPMIALALLVSPAGARFSVDAWRRGTQPLPTHVPGGAIRFFQLFLVTMYSGSGIAKIRGEWLSRPVLFTHLHDSYQTSLTYFLVGAVPGWGWSALQIATVIFEAGAPLWFALGRTRRIALVYGLTMHALIGLMFGPVIWFALLMSLLLVASFAALGA
jgi:hypothetical protein